MYDIDDRETGPLTRPFPLCNYRGCGGPHDHETVERPCSHQHEPQSPDCPRTKNLSITERPREMAKSPGGMKGGCSLFGLGSSWDGREDQSGRRELSSGNQQNDLYLREKDEIGTTCLSYKPSLLQSATLASGEDDFCRSSRKHGSRKDRQRPATCDSDHSCGCGGGLCTLRRATGAKIRAAKSECGKVPKCCGIAPFPRGNSSWLNSATQHKLRESPCSGRRLPRNKSFLQRLQKQEGECCERVSPGSFLREDTSWRSRQVRGSGQQGGADRCAGKTDDVYVCELDDVGTSSLFYKQRPSSCGFSDNEESPCELCRSKKAHPKDTCQHLSCKRYKSQPIPGRTRCSQCSDDTSSLMSLKQGDCHTSNYRTNGGSAPIICSLPQWPRHLLLQNNRAQATTTVYKN
ncbi:uncharacterized protein LOC127578712 [Pristis pectinata]|uniref:uncharacterized protein LOC127578712 n=1 Tax=Pristis pectinata TaxID=685728 RepID=UPI00223E1456|nr:uncharacterized protein LOC127578712 [Pristis pectinata]